ncbi:hypothetical protein QSJ18_14665 [Gordonia sp. ABSL1-1]|uniref:LGFP repeat-containing protein n=1 Tax=Gordonia sp. ABSL1-1 TaxID=3053923 RepID=UPI002572E550|nr:hypothetical protein [Gordonia sp. ABSL1-1]MDL9937993.1 hypothetical protein [Gordonia sp. ABSL1-1]
MEKTKARLGATGIGGVCALALALLLAPQAAADPQSDATAAIDQLVGRIQRGEADRGLTGAGLGDPQGGVTPVGAGFQQEFSGATIYWSTPTGATVLYGRVLKKYTYEGGPTGSLGFPTTSETSGPYGSGSRKAEFAAADRPIIFFTPAHNAWVVRGPFTAATTKLGQTLGPPTEDQTVTGDEQRQTFVNGSLTFNTASGEWAGDPASLADGLDTVAIPGRPSPGVGTPAPTGPNPSAATGTMTTPTSVVPAGATPNVTARQTDSGGSSGNWWWLLVPLLIVLGALVVWWLFKVLTRGHAASTGGALGQSGSDAVDGIRTGDGEVEADGAHAEGVETEGAETEAEAPEGIEPDDSGVAAAAVGAGLAGAAGAGVAAIGAADAEGRSETDTPEAVVEEVEPEDEPGTDFSLDEPVFETHVLDDLTDGSDPVFDTDDVGSGDGVGHFLFHDEQVPVPLGAHLPVDTAGAAPEGYPIKGDAATGLFHTADMPSFAEAAATVWFASEGTAIAGGFAKADVER